VSRVKHLLCLALLFIVVSLDCLNRFAAGYHTSLKVQPQSLLKLMGCSWIVVVGHVPSCFSYCRDAVKINGMIHCSIFLCVAETKVRHLQCEDTWIATLATSGHGYKQQISRSHMHNSS
jgi:hypothetical protein